MAIELNLDGLAPELATALQSEGAQQAIAAAIEAAKAPLIAKRDELLGQLSTTKATLTKVESLGGLEALTQVQQARLDAEAAQREAALKAGDVETVKKHYGEQLSAREQELNSLRKVMIDEKVSNKLSSAIREAKGVPELLEPHLRGRIKSDLVDGRVVLTVLTAAGVPMLKDDGKEATIVDLLNEFKDSPIFQRAFEAPGASGSGSRASGAPATNNPWNPATKNVTAQMTAYRTDKAAAIRMAAEHGVILK